MSIGASFTELFRSLNMITVCLWVTGFALFCIEMFQPMRNLLYALGTGMITAAFVTHVIHASTGEAFVFLLLTAAALFVVHIIALAVQKRDWLNVARMTRAGTRTKKLSSLVGAYGVASTTIAFTGNAAVGDVNLFVYSDTPISPGEKVMISEVTPDRITVIPVK